MDCRFQIKSLPCYETSFKRKSPERYKCPLPLNRLRGTRFPWMVAASSPLKSAWSTIAAFELGVSSPQPRLMEALIATLESAGVVFIEPREGEHGPAVVQMGSCVTGRQPGEGEAAGEDGKGGLKAAWDDFEEAADLDTLLSEVPAPDPDMAEYGGPLPSYGRPCQKAAGRR